MPLKRPNTSLHFHPSHVHLTLQLSLSIKKVYWGSLQVSEPLSVSFTHSHCGFEIALLPHLSW